MTILEAMRAPALFGATFDGPSWDRWRVFLAAAFGLPLSTTLLCTRYHTDRLAALGYAVTLTKCAA